MDQKTQEPVEVDSCRDGRELLRITKQRTGRTKMLLGLVILKVKVGWWKLRVDDRKKIWKVHIEKLMNVEIEWIALMLVM